MRVMTISDNPNMFSGLARVHRNVIDMFKDCELKILAWHLYTNEQVVKMKAANKIEPVFYRTGDQEFEITGIPKKSGNNSMFAVFDQIEKFKPDVVLSIGDYSDFWYMKAIKEKLDYKFKWIPYLTIEHDEFDVLVSTLKVADAIMVPSLFGKNVLEKELGKEVIFVPYGIDKAFKRVSQAERDELKNKYRVEKRHRFIAVGQNTWRKQIPVLIQTMDILKGYGYEDDVELYIHTNIHATDPLEAALFNLKEVANKLKVDVRFPDDSMNHSLFDAPSDEIMADLYSVSDYFISSSICEGFGLPIVEAMACGLPAVCNGSSTIYEHLGAEYGQHGNFTRGYVAKHRTEICPPARMIHSPDAVHLAQGMITMVDMSWHEESMEGMRKACIEYASRFDWNVTRSLIRKKVEEIAGKPTQVPVEIL
jgi:glycosyltransferase involved in cell wall biosynthesis